MAGVEGHQREAQRYAVERRPIGRSAAVVVTEQNVLRGDVKHALTRPWTVWHHRSRCLTAIGFGDAVVPNATRTHPVPDQTVGRDARDIGRAAQTIDGRCVQHELDRRSGVAGRVQRRRADHVDRAAGGENEFLQCRKSGYRARSQEPVQDVLGQIPPLRQHARRSGGGERVSRSDIDHLLRHGEVSRTEIDVADRGAAGGGDHDAAVGEQRGAAVDVDCAGAERWQEIEVPVRHRQHRRRPRCDGKIHVVGVETVSYTHPRA